MQKQQPSRRLSLGIIAGISVLVLAIGGGTAWWALRSLISPNTERVGITNPTKPRQIKSNTLAVENKVNVYWLEIADNKTELVETPITVENSGDRERILASALEYLFSGPEADLAYTSTIPEGTKLLSLSVKNDEVKIDLSREFTKGGGSKSTIDRLGQVLYTATTLDPQSKVWINIEGEPLDTLGGEGVEVAQPLTRQEFQENFSL